MPSLRQKVTTYFRQLSFIADSPRSPASNSKKSEDNNFVIKFLEGTNERIYLSSPPEINFGPEPQDLPDYEIFPYPVGQNTITAACTGPDEGLTGIKRCKLHLSAGSDIDFIDDQELDIRKSISNHNKLSKLNQSNSLQKFRSDQNANKTPTAPNRSRKNSRSNALDKQSTDESNKNSSDTKETTIIVSMISTDSPKLNNLNKKTELNELTALQTIPMKISDSDIIKNLLLRTEKENKVPNTQDISNNLYSQNDNNAETICGVTNWKMDSDNAYGISVSLYEYNMLTKESVGNPIADCYGIVTRGNVCAMAMADGVNWGDGARLAARSAVHGSLDYLNTAIFGFSQDSTTTTTRHIFVSLLRSLWEGHECILEVGGALSTLTIAVVLPLNGQNKGKYIVCACNVGDSLGYVYSKKYGVREFTQGSHDLSSMRDMRDALGALGPVDGNKPELSNLTFSMTICDPGDIVFLTSDGISDNFDPCVGKFAEAWTPDTKIRSVVEPQLAAKRQNKSSSAIYARSNSKVDSKEIPASSRSNKTNINVTVHATNSAPPVRPPRAKKSPSPSYNGQPLEKSASLCNVPSRPKYMRSHTVIEPRISSSTKQSPRSSQKFPSAASGLPLVTGPQRHTLTLLRFEDLLSYGINGQLAPCPSARRLCHLLIDFVRMITSARRKTLEQREIFYKFQTGPDAVKREVEMNRIQHRAARKRVVDSKTFMSLPGKLDHASVVAYTVGSGLQTKEFQETNF